MIDAFSRYMLTEQVMGVKRDRTSGQSFVDEPTRGRRSSSGADDDAARCKLRFEGEKRLILQDTMSPSAFVFPRPLSVDLLLEDGGILG